MNLSEEQIVKLAPKATAFKAGKKLAVVSKWLSFAKSERSIWGAIKGSGKNPYHTQIDIENLAYKCTCPSRQFPCKHSLALLLLYSHHKTLFNQEEEPTHVKEWLDKRKQRAEKVAIEEKEITAAQKAKQVTSKAKRDASRTKMVQTGIQELRLWLQDLLRLGLLNLPTKRPSDFEKVAARMVDAKAPGLANWVRAFQKIDYTNGDAWQEAVLTLIAKINLLTKGFEQQQFDETTQQMLKGLIGWNYKTKDLLANEKTLTIKDQWLVLGIEREVFDQDLTVIRTWLYGLNQNQTAIIIDFETKFTEVSKTHLLEATVLEAELAFYPSSNPHRAFIKKQKSTQEYLSYQPVFLNNWLAHHQQKVQYLQRNPWSNNQAFLIRSVKFVRHEKDWIICDEEKHYQKITPSYPRDPIFSGILLSENQFADMAIVEKNDGYYPLGIFKQNKYICL